MDFAVMRKGEPMRLIDADALIPMMRYATTDSEIGVFPIKIGFDAIVEVINSQSTIEPERKKGKWIKKEKIYPELPEDSDYEFECSLCGWSDEHDDKMIVPYCWHCGAEMSE